MALPPETCKMRARSQRRQMASSAGAAKRASSCHVRSASGAGNGTQVRRKSWMRRRTPEELTYSARLEKKEGSGEPACAELFCDGVD